MIAPLKIKWNFLNFWNPYVFVKSLDMQNKTKVELNGMMQKEAETM